MRSTTGLYQPSTGSCIQSNIGLTTLSLDLSSRYNWFLVLFLVPSEFSLWFSVSLDVFGKDCRLWTEEQGRNDERHST